MLELSARMPFVAGLLKQILQLQGSKELSKSCIVCFTLALDVIQRASLPLCGLKETLATQDLRGGELHPTAQRKEQQRLLWLLFFPSF